ncbi:hypothetical protein DAPPUDRAFT_239254 [Daphnia pulex]|uniref:Uncharacterized protein n=1 Tax=Daphnia pulex TaxID=6669 RepID=E9G8S2_DAPPU|nr:hypothetical protein DAPPUDRAFT_239254 [Daphnia pulex]|eukprot:EFX84219.1 hypothetical protein DAPPUDRAFT_239254 [Daphnia pulex]
MTRLSGHVFLVNESDEIVMGDALLPFDELPHHRRNFSPITPTTAQRKLI